MNQIYGAPPKPPNMKNIEEKKIWCHKPPPKPPPKKPSDVARVPKIM